jgi:hypothetical protein
MVHVKTPNNLLTVKINRKKKPVFLVDVPLEKCITSKNIKSEVARSVHFSRHRATFHIDFFESASGI